MRDPKSALLFLQDLRKAPIGMVLDSGIIFLLDNGVTDWYVFLNAESLTREDAASVDALVAGRGERSEFSLCQLSTHPKKAFVSTGTLEQIMDSLDALGEEQRDVRLERIWAKAQQN